MTKKNKPGNFRLPKDRAREYGSRGRTATTNSYRHVIDGKYMTSAEMAEYFGITVDGVKDRMKRLRAKGLGITGDNMRSVGRKKQDG